jgi:hypothetical protein
MCELLPNHKEVIRSEGLSFLARRNYNRAKAIKSLPRRFAAYLIVFRKFNHRYLPPLDCIIPKRFWPGHARGRNSDAQPSAARRQGQEDGQIHEKKIRV